LLWSLDTKTPWFYLPTKKLSYPNLGNPERNLVFPNWKFILLITYNAPLFNRTEDRLGFNSNPRPNTGCFSCKR
jgi:hypothetical protein